MSVIETIYGFGEQFKGSSLDLSYIGDGISIFTHMETGSAFYGIVCEYDNVIKISDENRKKVDELYERVRDKHFYTLSGYYNCIKGYDSSGDMVYMY